jgi:hypothetical protein
MIAPRAGLPCAVALACACSGAGQRSVGDPLPRPARDAAAPTSQSAAGSGGRISGELERKQRRMKIWGQVERLRRGKHGDLPPVTATARGGVGDPVTEIKNDTRFTLTIWFAGPCGHQVEVKPRTALTAVFCAGTYNLAAMVEEKSFLPLVRENQQFEEGVQYKLEFFVERPPR